MDKEHKLHLVNGYVIATTPVKLSLPGFAHVERMAILDGDESPVGWGATDEEAIEELMTKLD